MTRESMLELTAEAAQGLRPILMNACLESALLRTFHETSAFFCICLTGQSALRYGSGLEGLCSGPRSEWGELRFRLFDKRGYYPERWLFKAQRRLKFMGIDSRIGFTRKASSHIGWIRAPDLAEAADLANTNSLVDTAGSAEPKRPAAAPPGVRFLIHIPPGPVEAPAPGRIVLVEGWGECFSLRLED